MQKLCLQDSFLNEARKKNIQLTVFLVNGFQMRGTVASFDSFTVLLETEGKQQLVYKHAISTVAPQRNIEIRMDDGESPGRSSTWKEAIHL